MDIEKLINNIIPPADYRHRNGFSNSDIIDQLNEHEKKLVEEILINKLLGQTDDTLIVETLAYLKSEKALSILYDFLERCSDPMAKIISATSIFEINGDTDMIDIAVASFRKLEDDKNPYYIYILPFAFNYLIKFKSAKVNSIIEEYTNHKEYLISYNAKKTLGK